MTRTAQSNTMQAAIENIGTQLYNAFMTRRADICANCYEPYGIVNCDKTDNIIGREEIAAYWQSLLQRGLTVYERSTPQIVFDRKDMLTVHCQWKLSDGSSLKMRDTWAKQADNTFKLLMQAIFTDGTGQH